jgi:hypothetical protein
VSIVDRNRSIFVAFVAALSSLLSIALISLLLFQAVNMMIVVILIGAAHIVLLGIPAFLILNWVGKIRWWTSILAGYVCGAVPTAYTTRILVLGSPGSNSSHGSGDNKVITMVDGVATTAGWFDYILAFSLMGLFGAFAALVFWAVWTGLKAP